MNKNVKRILIGLCICLLITIILSLLIRVDKLEKQQVQSLIIETYLKNQIDELQSDFEILKN